MGAHGNRTGLVLAWAWLLALGIYLAWGVVAEAGLYGWLVDLQVARWGQYYPKLTALVPALVLGAPALTYIRRRSQRDQLADRIAGPAAEARRAGRNARYLLLFGIAALLVGGGAYLLSQSIPESSGPPQPLDAATLGTGPAPAGPVTIRGAIDPEIAAGIEETGGAQDKVEYYVAFRPEGVGAGGKPGPGPAAPVRLFVARTAYGADARTTQGFMPEQTGWLEQDGLPQLARDQLESRGVRIAEPHYVLRSSDPEPRAPYYITAALGTLIGLAFVVVGLVGMTQARGRLRRAETG